MDREICQCGEPRGLRSPQATTCQQSISSSAVHAIVIPDGMENVACVVLYGDSCNTIA